MGRRGNGPVALPWHPIKTYPAEEKPPYRIARRNCPVTLTGNMTFPVYGAGFFCMSREPIDDGWWMSGFCSTFAGGLKHRFGGELWAIVNHSRKYNDDQLWHCYCVINGSAYDATGGHTIEEASDTSEEKWPIPEIDKECDVVMQWRKVDERWLADVHEDFNPDDYDAVNDFIDRHPHRFIDLLNRGQQPQGFRQRIEQEGERGRDIPG